MLTVETLKTYRPGLIDHGFIENGPGQNQVHIFDYLIGERLLWVAVKGGGYDDWAIYVEWAEHSTVSHCMFNGNKVNGYANIKKIMPCSDEVLKLYRK